MTRAQDIARLEEIATASVTELNALRAVVEQNSLFHKLDKGRTVSRFDQLETAVHAIEEQLPNFKLSRKGKRKGKK